MATSTNGYTISKVARIQEEEKELLFRLREIFANDYRKYSEYIKHELDVPASVKKIYKTLDERKAYRRISDYFHRERTSRKTRDRRTNDLRSYHRSSTRDAKMPIIQANNHINDEDQQSETSPMTNDSNERIEIDYITDNVQDIQPASSINSTHKQRLSLAKTPHQQQPVSQSSTSSKLELLSVRESIQKALSELDRVIISKSDDITEEHDHEQQRSFLRKTNFLIDDHGDAKLDDIVRSLSTVVNQQQDNVRLIINQSSSLLVNDNNQSQESIKHVLERLNTLVDRGHCIYDKIENILSDF